MPQFRSRQVLTFITVLALSIVPVACGDDDDDGPNGGNGGTADQTPDVACTVGAFAVELIGEGLRQGHSVKEIISAVGPGLDEGCKAAVAIFKAQPQKPLDLTIRDPAGSELTETLSGFGLEKPAPATSTGDCSNYTIYELWRLCIEARLEALQRPVTP
jgi:hypothetical protein